MTDRNSSSRDAAGPAPPRSRRTSEGEDAGPAQARSSPVAARRGRIQRSTARGGLRALPPGFGEPEGDWRTVESDDLFERLYLDGEQHEHIDPALVRRHYELLAAFWEERLARLRREDDPEGGSAAGRDEGAVERCLKRLEYAYWRLGTREGLRAYVEETRR